MRVRCPNCHDSTEVDDNTEWSNIACPSCGSKFSLVADHTLTYTEAETKTIGSRVAREASWACACAPAAVRVRANSERAKDVVTSGRNRTGSGSSTETSMGGKACGAGGRGTIRLRAGGVSGRGQPTQLISVVRLTKPDDLGQGGVGADSGGPDPERPVHVDRGPDDAETERLQRAVGQRL